MNHPELRNLLEQLRQEIEQTDNIAAEDRKRLNQTAAAIRTLLERSKDEEPPFPLDLRQLEETIQLFEVTHPALTATLTRLLAILSNAGI